MSMAKSKDHKKSAPETSCKQAARLVSLSFERKLTIPEKMAMHAHLLTCKTCSFYRRQITSLRKAFVRHEEVLDNTPADACECLSSESKQRLKDLLAPNK